MSKKKLQQKNRKLVKKLQIAGKGKSELRHAMKDAKKDSAYWEDQACVAEDELQGLCGRYA